MAVTPATDQAFLREVDDELRGAYEAAHADYLARPVRFAPAEATALVADHVLAALRAQQVSRASLRAAPLDEVGSRRVARR